LPELLNQLLRQAYKVISDFFLGSLGRIEQLKYFGLPILVDSSGWSTVVGFSPRSSLPVVAFWLLRSDRHAAFFLKLWFPINLLPFRSSELCQSIFHVWPKPFRRFSWGLRCDTIAGAGRCLFVPSASIFGFDDALTREELLSNIGQYGKNISRPDKEAKPLCGLARHEIQLAARW